MAAAVGLGACGASGSPASQSGHLSPAIRGRPGSGAWCTGMERTGESLVALGQGESTGDAARIVRNDERRVESALRVVPPGSGATAALDDAAHAARLAASELRLGRQRGLAEASRASADITLALTRLRSTGRSC